MCVSISQAQNPPLKIECHRSDCYCLQIFLCIKHKAQNLPPLKWVGITLYVLCIDTRIGLALNLKFTAFNLRMMIIRIFVK